MQENTTLPHPQQATFMGTETTLKQSGRLLLTNYRLMWMDGNSTKSAVGVVLPVKDISYIGYKSVTSWFMIIFGIFLMLGGLGAWVGLRNDGTALGIMLITFGLLLIFGARSKRIVFSTSGGDLEVRDNDLGNLRDWADAVMEAKAMGER